jgi:hypothetical protein
LAHNQNWIDGLTEEWIGGLMGWWIDEPDGPWVPTIQQSNNPIIQGRLFI